MLYNRPTFRTLWNCPRLYKTPECRTNSYSSQSQSGLCTKMNGSISKKKRRTNRRMPHSCIANSYLYPAKTYWLQTLTQTKNLVGLNRLSTQMRLPFASLIRIDAPFRLVISFSTAMEIGRISSYLSTMASASLAIATTHLNSQWDSMLRSIRRRAISPM